MISVKPPTSLSAVSFCTLEWVQTHTHAVSSAAAASTQSEVKAALADRMFDLGETSSCDCGRALQDLGRAGVKSSRVSSKRVFMFDYGDGLQLVALKQ